ncbi:MAG TPA: YsnF/AvaK domain-containing protein, partial [Acetobacteraceae bacterium]|nr:YsnF/AvaK domain-containing protein [Acetobacteraceae bacterium]
AQQTDYRSDADRYDQRSSAGDTVLSVTLTDDTQIHRTIEVLEAHHPVGIDETTDDYEGAASTDASASRGSAASTDTYASPGLSTSAAASPSTTSSGETRTAVQGREEEVIPLAKEEVDIGKRQVDRGTTRVRRYVVETPVEREVNLQGERVTVERRRPAAGAASGAGQFEERVVELHETEEVPVVQKTARVDEEVVVRREPTERTETVRDTVRREQVEVTPDQAEHKRSE